MNDLARRKRLLIVQADLHRGLVRLECARWPGRCSATVAGAWKNRWWLAGGAVVGGALLVRHWRKIIPWLPAVVTLLRALQ